MALSFDSSYCSYKGKLPYFESMRNIIQRRSCLPHRRKKMEVGHYLNKNRLRAMLHSTQSIECEFIYETALPHESEDPGLLFDEKNRGSKIS
jgi:hypothetical protein